MSRHFLAATLTAAIFSVVAATASAYPSPAPNHGDLDRVGHTGGPPAMTPASDRPRLGVAISAMPQQELDRLGLEYGVRVEDVAPGSVAAASGLRIGDTVTGVDGRPVYSPERLQYLVREASDRASIEVIRDGGKHELQARFVEPTVTGHATLGVRIQAMTDDLLEAFGAQGGHGVLVSQVMRGSAAAAAGLRAGDVILGIAGEDVATVGDVRRTVRGYAPGDEIAVTILRDRSIQQIDVALGEAPAMAGTHPGKHPYGMRGHGKHHGHGWHGKKHGCQTQKPYRPS